MWVVLNTFAPLINAITTIILVIITAIYAYFTYSMSKLMAAQVISDINVSNTILESPFLTESFLNKLTKHPEQINNQYRYYFFFLHFDVRNKSSGSGSIDKPTLILQFGNDNFSLEPLTRFSRWEKTANSTFRTVNKDLGGTIFLRGGDSKKERIQYMLPKSNEDLWSHIRNEVKEAKYHVVFGDNLGKTYTSSIDEIVALKEEWVL